MRDWSIDKIVCPDEEIRLRCVELYNNLTYYDLIKDGCEDPENSLNTKAMYDYYNNKIKELTKWHYGVPITIFYLIEATRVFTVEEDTLFVVHVVEYLNGKAKTLDCFEASGDEIVDNFLVDEDVL